MPEQHSLQTPEFRERLAETWDACRGRFDQSAAALVAYGNPSSDPETLSAAQDAAHRLAGTLGVFGLPEVAARCHEMDVRFDDASDLPSSQLLDWVQENARWVTGRIADHDPRCTISSDVV